MAKTNNKIKKVWNQGNIDKALRAIRNEGSTIKGAARKFGMSEGTLRNRIKYEKERKAMAVNLLSL